MSHRREYDEAMQMEREGKRCSAYASRYHRSKLILIDLIAENDQWKFHSQQTISAPFRARVLRLADFVSFRYVIIARVSSLYFICRSV